MYRGGASISAGVNRFREIVLECCFYVGHFCYGLLLSMPKPNLVVAYMVYWRQPTTTQKTNKNVGLTF